MIIQMRVTHVGERVLVRQLETIHFVDLGIDGKITVKWILKMGRRAWIGFIWHRTGTSGQVLVDTFRCHEM
jgi:hypothetical protein